MTILAKHLFSQRRVVAALGRVVFDAMRPARVRARIASAVPGVEVQACIAPPDAELIADYLSDVGGARDAYAGKVPAHLFPHWSFPPLVQCLRTTPYALMKALNVGCRLQMNAALSSAHALDIRARLIDVKDEGGRAVLHARVTTGQAAHLEALVADLYAVVPSLRPRAASSVTEAKPERERPSVPVGAQALEPFRLERNAGLHFALLTGDLNPIHWLTPYARAAGFAGPILHGFALLARSIEVLIRNRFGGSPERLHSIDVRFTRPLTLPAEVTLYAEEEALYVGDRPGALAYMTGTFSGR